MTAAPTYEVVCLHCKKPFTGELIGDDDNAVVFEFDPQVQAGAETLFGRRGQDPRLGER